MRTRRTLIGLVIAVFALALALLVVVGLLLRSAWDTFVPDLIIGLVVAGGIAVAVVWFTSLDQDRRDKQDRLDSAYWALIDSLADVRAVNLEERIDMRPVTHMQARMGNLIDVSDDAWMGPWLHAERLLLMHTLQKTNAILSAEPAGVTIDQAVENRSGPLIWTRDFASNLRLWHAGKANPTDIERQTAAIKTKLAAVGAWTEDFNANQSPSQDGSPTGSRLPPEMP